LTDLPLFFSAIIPLYNKQNTIQRAIRAVLAQTVQDFELIIVDDGSTDGSYAAASAISDPRIKIIRQENRGVSAARNRGVAEANCDWVAFLDADDEWLPEFLQKMLDLMAKFSQCRIFGCLYYRFDGKNTYTVTTSIANFPIGWEGEFDNYFEYINELIPYNSSSVVISKESLVEIGGLPENIPFMEDTDTWTRRALSYDSAFLNLPLTIYHLESDNRARFNRGSLETLLDRWQEWLSGGQVPERMKESFGEYLVRYRIFVIQNYLSQGNFSKARELLALTTNSKRYQEKINKLSKRANRPELLVRSLLWIRRVLLFLANRISDFLGLN
jgi:glycosyltransferase involved in cell wall biosynthesis